MTQRDRFEAQRELCSSLRRELEAQIRESEALADIPAMSSAERDYLRGRLHAFRLALAWVNGYAGTVPPSLPGEAVTVRIPAR